MPPRRTDACGTVGPRLVSLSRCRPRTVRRVFRRRTHMTCQQTAAVRNSKSSWRNNIPQESIKAGRIRSVSRVPISLAIRSKNFHNFLDRIPIPVRSRNTKKLLKLSEITDRLHFAAIEAGGESVLNGDDLQKPVILRGQIKRKRRRNRGSFG